jgi:abortive infection bacteriophage resistance protein
MFGDLSKLYSNLHVKNRKLIATTFGYDEGALSSWFRSLNLLRNKCACVFRANVTPDSEPKWPPAPNQNGPLLRRRNSQLWKQTSHI